MHFRRGDFTEISSGMFLIDDDYYIDALKQVIEYAKDKNIALMCAEENPENCHRGYIVSHTLLKQDIKVEHIRKDGNRDVGRRFHKPFQNQTGTFRFDKK